MGSVEKPWKNTFQFYLELFASTTVIRAFSFIKASRLETERIFWICLVIVFIGLTMNDVRNSVVKYLGEPTVSHLTISKNNSIFFKDPTICFVMDLNFVKFKIDLTNITIVDRILQKFESKNITKLFDEYINMNYQSNPVQMDLKNETSFQTKMKLLNTTMTDSDFLSFLYATTMVMDNIVTAETSVGALNDSNRNNWGLRDPTTNFIISSTSFSLFKINQFLMKKSPDYKLLIKQVSALLCAQLNAKFFQAFRTFLVVETPCIPANAYYFGIYPLSPSRLLCMQVLGSQNFIFRYSENPAGAIFDVRNFYSEGYPSDLVFILDFAGSFGARNRAYSLKTNLAASISTTTTINGLYLSKSLNRRPCLIDSPYGNCYVNCRAFKIQKLCKCDPLSTFRLQTSHQPICGTVSLFDVKNQWRIPRITEMACSNLSIFGLDDSDCDVICPESCETLLLSHRIDPSQNESVFVDYNFIMIQEISTFTFPLVVETLSMELRDLITSLGANLSIWLGASFLALIHIIVFFVKIPFEYYLLCLQF